MLCVNGSWAGHGGALPLRRDLRLDATGLRQLDKAGVVTQRREPGRTGDQPRPFRISADHPLQELDCVVRFSTKHPNVGFVILDRKSVV